MDIFAASGSVDLCKQTLTLNWTLHSAPPLHNLLRLARAAGLEVDDTTADKLTTVTAFNLEARYPDFKRTFRLICTPEYTTGQMAIIKELMQWLKSQLPYNAA